MRKNKSGDEIVLVKDYEKKCRACSMASSIQSGAKCLKHRDADLKTWTERDLEILESYKEHKLEKVAEMFDLTHQRISQILAKAKELEIDDDFESIKKKRKADAMRRVARNNG